MTATAPEPLTLFDPEDLLEWVVEVDEVLLNSTGAQPRGPMNWWAETSGRPGIARRTEAGWLRDILLAHGLHEKGVTVRQLGRIITCRGCGQRRPFWVRTRRSGQLCRPCWTDDSRVEVA